jgi:D-alanyl-D-alanine carboxypeptidase
MLKSRMTRTIPAVVVLAVLLASSGARASVQHAAMVVDANTGTALYADAADELCHPASLAKIMTLYLVFEAIERGRLSYATRIRVSPEAAAAPPTKLGLDPGSDIALVDAVKALITRSANDMAVAIAEHISGSEMRFAQLMTEKAQRLGMTRTVFKNASGLHDPDQVTTARDMLRLALRLQDDFPRHYRLFALRSFSYGGVTLRNHNLLLGTFPGTDGIKTGYTRMSGFNLVASVRFGGRHVIGAVFGGRSASSRDATMRLILTRALRQASLVETRKQQPILIAQPQPARRPPAAVPAGSGAVSSTLDRQAMNLDRGAPAVQHVQAGAAQPIAHSVGGGFEVQVGAFASAAEAERALVFARDAADGLLDAHAARTIPVEKDSRQLYRARFSGFDAAKAASACLELRRRQIDCFVLKAE